MMEPIVTRCRFPFAETIERLTTAMNGAGMTVFAVIDQRALAQAAGLSLRPTTLIVFGNPKGGTPLMDSHPLIALELPLKVIVWAEAEIVKLAYIPMTAVAQRYGFSSDDARIAAFDRLLEKLTAAAT